jgi:hypothetical protein
MTEHDAAAAPARPAGYGELIERFGLEVVPNWHRSLVWPR